jgi:hypothetical protein
MCSIEHLSDDMRQHLPQGPLSCVRCLHNPCAVWQSECRQGPSDSAKLRWDMRRVSNYIAGASVAPKAGKYVELINPFNG